MSVVEGFSPFLEEARLTKKTISGQGATRTLSVDESGSTVLFDRAAGIVYTLPLAKPGVFFDFVITTTITSNSAKVITGAATEFLIGGYTNVDTDTSNAVAVFTGNGSTHVAVTQNGTTTGGVLGTKLRFTCLSSTRWFVEGVVQGSGVVATAFATS